VGDSEHENINRIVEKRQERKRRIPAAERDSEGNVEEGTEDKAKTRLQQERRRNVSLDMIVLNYSYDIYNIYGYI
jgi:hypothetical protein